MVCSFLVRGYNGHEGVVSVKGDEAGCIPPGVYVVSVTESLYTYDGKLIDAPLAVAEFERWLGVCPQLTLDGVRPTVQQLMDRIRRFWIPDEVILYIRLAIVTVHATRRVLPDFDSSLTKVAARVRAARSAHDVRKAHGLRGAREARMTVSKPPARRRTSDETRIP